LNDVRDARPAFVPILARWNGPELLANTFLMHSAEAVFGADSIVAFNDDSDFIPKRHDPGIDSG
jgi:hypothetical protein